MAADGCSVDEALERLRNKTSYLRATKLQLTWPNPFGRAPYAREFGFFHDGLFWIADYDRDRRFVNCLRWYEEQEFRNLLATRSAASIPEAYFRELAGLPSELPGIGSWRKVKTDEFLATIRRGNFALPLSRGSPYLHYSTSLGWVEASPVSRDGSRTQVSIPTEDQMLKQISMTLTMVPKVALERADRRQIVRAEQRNSEARAILGRLATGRFAWRIELFGDFPDWYDLQTVVNDQVVKVRIRDHQVQSLSWWGGLEDRTGLHLLYQRVLNRMINDEPIDLVPLSPRLQGQLKTNCKHSGYLDLLRTGRLQLLVPRGMDSWWQISSSRGKLRKKFASVRSSLPLRHLQRIVRGQAYRAHFLAWRIPLADRRPRSDRSLTATERRVWRLMSEPIGIEKIASRLPTTADIVERSPGHSHQNGPLTAGSDQERASRPSSKLVRSGVPDRI